VNDANASIKQAGILEGDEQVWRKLLAEQIPALYSMFMHRWYNPALAEELVQKTVFDAVRGRSSYNPEKGSPHQWIGGIARNNIRLEIRRRATRPSINGDISTYLEIMDKSELPDEVLEKKETSELVRRAMEQLEDNQQEVLTKKYIENLSAREIAETMGLTEKAVHSLLYRARKSFEKELKLQSHT
jgi:RNA polymerase sigma-70 factor (ECF subfamily)